MQQLQRRYPELQLVTWAMEQVQAHQEERVSWQPWEPWEPQEQKQLQEG